MKYYVGVDIINGFDWATNMIASSFQGLLPAQLKEDLIELSADRSLKIISDDRPLCDF